MSEDTLGPSVTVSRERVLEMLVSRLESKFDMERIFRRAADRIRTPLLQWLEDREPNKLKELVEGLEAAVWKVRDEELDGWRDRLQSKLRRLFEQRESRLDRAMDRVFEEESLNDRIARLVEARVKEIIDEQVRHDARRLARTALRRMAQIREELDAEGRKAGEG